MMKKKSGKDRIAERADEIRTKMMSPDKVAMPAGMSGVKKSKGGTLAPGEKGVQKVNDEASRKKFAAEESSVDSVATPSGMSKGLQ